MAVDDGGEGARVEFATALGVTIALNARGCELPRQFSVMGFDDIALAGFMTPSLTGMKQPRSQMGEAAMELLMALLEGRHVERIQVLLRSVLILRNSVARVSGDSVPPALRKR